MIFLSENRFTEICANIYLLVDIDIELHGYIFKCGQFQFAVTKIRKPTALLGYCFFPKIWRTKRAYLICYCLCVEVDLVSERANESREYGEDAEHVQHFQVFGRSLRGLPPKAGGYPSVSTPPYLYARRSSSPSLENKIA